MMKPTSHSFTPLTCANGIRMVARITVVALLGAANRTRLTTAYSASTNRAKWSRMPAPRSGRHDASARSSPRWLKAATMPVMPLRYSRKVQSTFSFSSFLSRVPYSSRPNSIAKPNHGACTLCSEPVTMPAVMKATPANAARSRPVSGPSRPLWRSIRVRDRWGCSALRQPSAITAACAASSTAPVTSAARSQAIHWKWSCPWGESRPKTAKLTDLLVIKMAENKVPPPKQLSASRLAAGPGLRSRRLSAMSA